MALPAEPNSTAMEIAGGAEGVKILARLTVKPHRSGAVCAVFPVPGQGPLLFGWQLTI
jgi:hypothetical protein